MHMLNDPEQLSQSPSVELLILGAGWTSTFLIPLCVQRHLTYAATTRSGNTANIISTPDPDSVQGHTIKFSFDPFSEDPAPFKVLPSAQTVLVTFPIKVRSIRHRLLARYILIYMLIKDLRRIGEARATL
jgi:hypothetical protein